MFTSAVMQNAAHNRERIVYFFIVKKGVKGSLHFRPVNDRQTPKQMQLTITAILTVFPNRSTPPNLFFLFFWENGQNLCAYFGKN
jgi:hypothetical protein